MQMNRDRASDSADNRAAEFALAAECADWLPKPASDQVPIADDRFAKGGDVSEKNDVFAANGQTGEVSVLRVIGVMA